MKTTNTRLPESWMSTILRAFAIAPYAWFILVLYTAMSTGRTLGDAAAFWVYQFPLLLPLAFVGVCFWNHHKEFTLKGTAIAFLMAITGAPVAWVIVVFYIMERSDRSFEEAADHWAYQLPVSFVVMFALFCYQFGREHRNRSIEGTESTN